MCGCEYYTLNAHTCVQLLDSGLSWTEELQWALRALALLLRDEKTISAYEVLTSRLVPILLHCLTGSGGETDMVERKRIFKTVFTETADKPPADLDPK